MCLNSKWGRRQPAIRPVFGWGGTHNWLTIGDIKGKYTPLKTKETITDAAVSETGIKLVPKGTVVMSFKLSLGKATIVSEDLYTNEAIMAFINKGNIEINNEYLYYYLSGQNWAEGTNKAVKGKTLNKATIGQREITIPDMECQLEIVRQLNKVNEGIEISQKIIEKLEASIKARFVEMFGDPVRNPQGWEKRKLSDLADIKIGPFGSLIHKEDYIVGGHALVNPSHIIDDTIIPDDKLTVSDEKYAELSPYHLYVGDVVMGRRGEMGRCAVISQQGLLCGTGSLLIRTYGNLSADFIQKILSFPTFKRIIEDMAVGQTMPNLNVPIVSDFQIITPPMDIQEQYYDFVSQIDKSKLIVQKIIDKLSILRASLMQQYFS